MATAIMVMALAVPGWSFVAWGTRVFYAVERSRYSAAATTTGWILVIVGMVGAILVTGSNGNPGLTLICICSGYVLGMTVAGVFLLVNMRRVLGPAGLALVGRRSLLALGAAVVAGTAGVVTRSGSGLLDNSASSAVTAGIVAALLGCVVFGIIVLVVDRGFLGEVRGLLADRNRAGVNDETTVHAAEAKTRDHGPSDIDRTSDTDREEDS